MPPYPLVFVLLVPCPTTLAGPGEGVSGEMVVVARKVRTPAGVLVIRDTPEGVVLEGAGVRATAKSIRVDELDGELVLEGTPASPVVWSEKVLGGADRVSRGDRVIYYFRTGDVSVFKIQRSTGMIYGPRAVRAP
jgi:hypothetical protein